MPNQKLQTNNFIMNEEIKQHITELLPTATFDETGEWLNITIEPVGWRILANNIRYSKFNFNYLFCLTCVDWKTHLTMVYHLSSTTNRQLNIVIKTQLERNNPEIETVSDIWRTADFHEREVHEM